MFEKREELLEALTVLDAAANNLTVVKSGIFGGAVSRLVNSICEGNLRNACLAFSALEAELISDRFGSSPRRVSGNLLTDAVLDAILLSDNPFSALAAKGVLDVPLYNAMENELRILEKLNSFTEDDFVGILNEMVRELNSSPRDSAVAAATAAWGGTAARYVPKENPQRRNIMAGLPIKSTRLWDYGEFKLNDEYYADEALSEMYRRFIITEDWNKLTEALWSFHAAYGTGDFLRYRNFRFDGTLKPLPTIRCERYIDFSKVEDGGAFFANSERAYHELLKTAIAFMQDERTDPMLLIGGAGTGKTRTMLHVVEELPLLRLVMVTGGCDRLDELFGSLTAQPQRFMVLIDDLKPDMVRGVIRQTIPENVLLAGCMDEKDYTDKLSGLFGNIIKSTTPCFGIDNSPEIMVRAILRERNIECGIDLIRNACTELYSEHEYDTAFVCSAASAFRIANDIIRRL